MDAVNPVDSLDAFDLGRGRLFVYAWCQIFQLPTGGREVRVDGNQLPSLPMGMAVWL